MLVPAEFLQFVVEWRIDVCGFLAGMLCTCLAARHYGIRHGVRRSFPPRTCYSALLLVVAGVFLAELTSLLNLRSWEDDWGSVLVARLSIMGATGIAGGMYLWATVQMALLRARVQAQADAERELHHAKLAADQANRAKGDFLAVMSHEIRTPLNAVMGFANLLRETKLEENQRGYLATIASEGERLGALINDLLDLSKIDGGQLLIERVPFAPAEVVADVLRLFAVRASERAIDLRFEGLIAGPLLVAGDPLRFRQVVVNLVDNALKFTPKGSVTVYLTWSAPTGAEDRGKLIVRVCDTGIGIPTDKLPRLFQMFMQADSSTSRTYGGTGLGLAICHRLVGLMGGEISVQSTPGTGTDFKFWLLLPPIPLAELPANEAGPEVFFATPPRILVVDDRDTNRFLLEVFLQRSGFETAMASGGEEAVQLAAVNRYDAILMDLQMPQVDGYMATARIRAAEPPGRRTIIIALTASIAKGTREKCLAAGMDEHLTKPLELDQFRRVLARLLAVRGSEASLATAARTA
jgi:signal transduction histidine kinase/ActR/RegA family two-component response regulator